MANVNNYALRANLTSTVYSGPSTIAAIGNGSAVVNTTGSNNGITQSIAAGTWTNLTTGSVTDTAYMFLQNAMTASTTASLLDAWYNIDIGTGTTAFASLAPQEFLLLPPTNSVYVARAANSASILTIVMANV
jgi:hypothetical protein